MRIENTIKNALLCAFISIASTTVDVASAARYLYSEKPTSIPEAPPGPPPGIHILPIEQMFQVDKRQIDRALRHRDEMATLGYSPVEDLQLQDFSLEHVATQFLPADSVTAMLTFQLSPISLVGPFKNMRFEGMVPSMRQPDGRWAKVERVYSLPNGGILVVEEWDIASSGGGIFIAQENVNASVNGTPAMFNVLKSSNGDAQSNITWAVLPAKLFTITIAGHVRGLGNENQLVKLASAVGQ